MLTLINTNRMLPSIAPIGVDYVAGAVRQAGFDVDVVDLCLAENPEAIIRTYFDRHRPELVGLTFRNSDDCFWPSAEWFVPSLAETVRTVRSLTDAPVALGGVGFSIFAEPIIEYTDAEFGVRGDGEAALVSLMQELGRSQRFDRVPGLIWRENGRIRGNPPAWPERLSLCTARTAVDNAAYFRRGGQLGLETKRGCSRQCIYCADPLAKGAKARLRDPREVADEVESLLRQGADVLHLCDSEFNIPADHAHAVCEELIRRHRGERVRWYTYMAVMPFDSALAETMRRAGCVGINFTGDSASEAMLSRYRQPHRRQDLASAVDLCRANGIRVMIDLLLGGPGETVETAGETIDFIKQINPDCAGAALGVRVYPGTAMERIVRSEGPLETNPSLRRKYEGPVDFFRPTFYISHALGERPGKVIRDLIAGDVRFFEPLDETLGQADPAADYNYNDNTPLVEAIANGARGAYWDILRRRRGRASGSG